MEQTSNRGCKNRRQRQRWWWSWSAFAGNFKAEEWGGWGVVPFKAVRVGQQHKAGIALHFTFKRRRVRGRKDLQTCILPLPGAGGGIKRYVLRSGSATVSIATASPCKVCTCILCWIYSAALLMDSQFPDCCAPFLSSISCCCCFCSNGCSPDSPTKQFCNVAYNAQQFGALAAHIGDDALLSGNNHACEFVLAAQYTLIIYSAIHEKNFCPWNLFPAK
ncbi:uncharacterized protein LOC124707098 isoform X2 [Lolium rigidum]|uniref:uncharacterized protein LOC124707098 isoform X2 n=1 Tax=Lolium rigidum TaxID=89674 RepID=UPI001F5D1040|nr:uncharacterized protein LOC124707098 isoform X2 [Lolium rigidum]